MKRTLNKGMATGIVAAGGFMAAAIALPTYYIGDPDVVLSCAALASMPLIIVGMLVHRVYAPKLFHTAINPSGQNGNNGNRRTYQDYRR